MSMDIIRLLICTTLLVLTAKATYSEDRLYFTNVLDIQLFMNNSTRKVIANLEFAEALDCNICDQQIYWVDSAGTIKRGSPGNDSSIKEIVKEDLVEPYGLAVDWKGSNVYFSQRRGPTSGHRDQGRIEVVKCDGSYRKVLLDKLAYPGPLALDITRGYLYFTNLTDILVADTAGQNVQLIYIDLDLNLGVGIVGLAVDTEANILYWTSGPTDGSLSEIRWINLTEWRRDPSSPLHFNTIQNTMGSDPHGIFILNNILYWTEPRIISQEDALTVVREGAIYSLNLQSSSPRKLVSNSSISPQDISSFASMPDDNTGCANANGGCSHFCFTVPNGQGGTRSTCSCPTGLRLRNNNTCPDFPNNFLLFLQNTTVTSVQTEIRIISLDIEDTFIDVLVPIDIPANSAFLAYNTPEHMVYWTQTDPPAIMRARLDGTEVEPFITSSIRDPEGIAVEPYSKNLFWVDSTLNRIEVVSLGDSQVRKVLIDGLDHPQGIALSLAQGCIYWTDLDASDTKVERAFMDGTGKKESPRSPRQVKKPTDITVDPLTNVVFWADVDRDRDHIVRFDGNTNAQGVELPISLLLEVKGLAVHGDFIYWTDIESCTSIGRARKENGNDRFALFENYDGVLGLVAVNVSEEVGTDCDFNSGGCSDLCLPNGINFTCGCREFFVLESDGRTCSDIPALVYIATEQALVPWEFDGTGRFLDRLDGNPQWDIRALAIAVDIRGERIYWISATDNLIYRQSVTADYDAPEQEKVISCCLGTPEDLAVDWFGRNLYWTDSTRGTVEVAKLDGRGRTVLAENLDHPPTLIVLDPLRGDLYWAPKRNVEIYRMKMNGNESTSGLFWQTHRLENSGGSIFGMAINYNGDADILYWGVIYDTDSGLFIMQSDLSNSNTPVETLVGDTVDQGTPFHIQTLQEETVYYHIDGGVNLIVSHSGNTALLEVSPGKFEDFLIAHHSLQPGIHECSINNGGCFGTETLCLVQDKFRGSCECPPWTARQVERTTEGETHQICLSTDTFVLIATSSDIHFLPVPPASSTVERGPPRPLPVGLFRNVSAISYDPITNSVLWVDSSEVLRSVTVNASLSSDILSLSGLAPASLVYDWAGGHVFVTEKEGFQIDLLTVNGEGRGSLLEDIQLPSDVVFDVDSRMLYWVDHGRRINHLSLESATSSPQTLPLAGSRRIRQLSFAAGCLFWINTDTQSSGISINKFNVANRSESVVMTIGQEVTVLTAAAVSGQPYIFWYNTSDRSIYYLHNGTDSEVYVQWTAPEDIVAFTGFERPTSILSGLPCLETPRPCSHICNRQFGGSAECACPVHRTLQDDEQTCSDVQCGALLIPCHGMFNECIPSYYLCDGISHCPGGSDELNCTCNTEEEFTCSSDTSICVAKSRQCDDRRDCPDNEDEDSGFCCDDDELGCYIDQRIYRCLPDDIRCDGFTDCASGIDEENCTTTPTTPATPPPAETTPSNNPDKRITYISIAVIGAIVLLIVLIIGLCFLIRVVRHHKLNHYSPNMARINHFASGKCSNPSPPPSGHRSESVSDINSELSMGTHSTRLGPYGSNLSPSSDSTKRFSAGAFSNPPPSPVTIRQSFVMTELGDGFSAFSQPDSECLPPGPNPSLNYEYDGMSSVSVSVSQRQFPVTLNGGIHRDPHRHIYGMPGGGGGVVRRGNPLMNNHHHHERYHPGAHHPYHHNSHPYAHSHTTTAQSSHYHTNPTPHQNHHFPFQSHDPTETDSTLSMTTAQTDNPDVFPYDAIHDVTPPGRPPSPATEVSEHYHVPTSPVSLISDDCSEECLHQV